MTNEVLIRLLSQDQVSLALWKISSPASQPRHLFMTHGTFSDRRICLGLARHLAERGFTCWILEWRGHGDSQRDPPPFNFETVALFDVAAALRYLLEEEGIARLHCVTHSGGGLALAMCLLRHPHFNQTIGKIALFACQAGYAAQTPWRRLRLIGMREACRLAGRLPGKRLGIGVQDESWHMMRQWFDWNIHRRFNGADGFDYLRRLPQISAPILAVFAENDSLIAPPSACRQFLAAFKGQENQALFCSVAAGFSAGYNHARVMHSSSASKEVWPLLLDWLEKPEARALAAAT